MSSEEEGPVAWLRKQIEAREAAARAVKDGSDPWDGQWQARDRHALETYNGWVIALAPGIRDSRDPSSVAAAEFPPGVVEHIAANDPRDVIARCEAELAMLDEHPPCADDATHCARCRNWLYEVQAPWPCTTISLVFGAYRQRPGYREDWGLIPG